MQSRIRTSRDRRHGFVLVELVVVCLLVLGAAVLFFAIVGKQRRSSQQTESVSNLRQIGAMTAAYGADSNGGLPTFTWRANVQYGNLGTAPNDIAAAALQATDIMRRRYVANQPTPTSWMPFPSFSSLVLADHFALAIPNPLFVSPGDSLNRQFVREVRPTTSLPPALVGQQHRLFQSSYGMTSAAYAGRETLDGGTLRHVSGGYSLYQYVEGNSSLRRFPLIARAAADIAFPSQKALQYEKWDWYSYSRPLYCAVGTPRCPVLMFDGAARVRQLQDANAGAYWSASSSVQYVAAPIQYVPVTTDPFSPQGPLGAPTEGSARLEFTFRQQLGRDFGPQVP